MLLGAGCLIIVVLTHVCETHHLFPVMGWGLRNSPGHYLDLSAAILGLAFCPAGYFLAFVPIPAYWLVNFMGVNKSWLTASVPRHPGSR
jgi:hypothetical protein